jgi:VanZ family protein
VNRFALIIAILFSVIVIYLGIAEADSININDLYMNDKLVHMFIYVLFYFVWYNSFLYFFKDKAKTYLFVFTLIFSSSIEIAQKYLTLTRNAEFMDIAFNVLGAVIAYTYFNIKKRII